jgi:hypothetical protein
VPWDFTEGGAPYSIISAGTATITIEPTSAPESNNIRRMLRTLRPKAIVTALIEVDDPILRGRSEPRKKPAEEEASRGRSQPRKKPAEEEASRGRSQPRKKPAEEEAGRAVGCEAVQQR